MTEFDNPYAAPRDNNSTAPVDSYSSQPTVTGDLTPAPRGMRFANCLIDQFALAGLSFAIGIALVAVAGEKGLELLDEPIGTLLSFASFVFCYFVMELVFGRTVGKIVTGTKVVRADGSRPSAGQIIGRTLSRIIPFEAFSFFSSPCVGWHDSLSGTRVVKTR